jgi:rhamnosyltransferase
VKASVIIPTKNGEEYLEECLTAVFNQKTAFTFEVIIVDSGSRDRTLEIIEKFQKKIHPIPPLKKEGDSSLLQREVRRDLIGLSDFKIYQIPPQEFGHGRTRNFAVSKTQGEYLVFLTQDATPADENWLANIIKPIEQDSEIAGVFGKHLPRKDCDPFQRRALNDFMNSFGAKTAIYQLSQEGRKEEEYEKNKHVLSFFSNVNSAIRRSVFEKIPFQEVEMGEDQFWAKDIILAGHKKAYEPQAAVYHSHNYGIWNQFKRWFDEFRQHKKNQNYVGVSGVWKIPFLALRLWFNDIKYIRSQSEYNLWQKIYWSIWIFFMDLARFCAEYLGGRYDKLPIWLQNRLSMQYEIIHKR